MNKKFLIILISMLLIVSALSSTANVLFTEEKESSNSNEQPINLPLRQQPKKIVKPKLKFFVREGFNKNLSNMTKNINKIYKDTNITFDWNGSNVTLTAADGWWGKKDWEVLKDLKTRNNCSKGINVVIAPNTYAPLTGANGITYFEVCNGSKDLPYGGIILKDTCNETQMYKTLAHELMHALGTSHEQIKWLNQYSGRNETKTIGSKLYNSTGSFKRNMPASKPVPPHGYGYYDKNGDCNLNVWADSVRLKVSEYLERTV